ncbi:hypothetical protein ADU59_21590 [Pararhizobium polonicum]|uniref:HTH-type transcriptional regulator TtuA n=1 Tax=Pararhizobium polonicum TaxID=1612624 RepID=A0A1C7NWT7_9HYPH|nr:LysR family transcriptional regulator [Pararhizobium polonicum]OBZ93449.1 hypothetical protein ADU59_21590 [Pararhizobium polonicum]
MRINYEISELVAFLAVAERLSYAAAAEELNVSPSSLTRRVQRLEYALECKLFERTTREVKLSLAGKQLFSRAREIVETLSEVQASFKGVPNFRSPTLTIACVPSVIRELIPVIQDDILRANPHARIRISDLSSNETNDAVLRSNADVGVGYLDGHTEGLDGVILREETFVLAMRKGHEFSGRNNVSWRELLAQRVIGPVRESGIRILIDSAMAKEGVTLKWFHEVRHTDTALLMAEAGIGVTAVPKSIYEESKNPNLVAVGLIEPEIKRRIGVLKRHGQPLRPLAREFWNALVGPNAQLAPS